jgi:putative PEP-CTERM system TPR-repeat lipoprotein
MRKAWLALIPLLILVAFGALWVWLHAGSPVSNARQRMAHEDMRGAEFYLRQALRRQPDNAEAAYLLGKVDLALGNPQAAELELRRARDHGYSADAIVFPLGQSYLQQQHFDAVLRDFNPDQARPNELADILTLRAAAQLSLGNTAAAAATITQAEAVAPNAQETLLAATRIALARDDLKGASQRVARILAREPGEPDAMLLQSEIDMRRNDPTAALAGAQKVLAGSPGRLDARMIEARALAALNKLDSARVAVAQVLRGAPKNTSANFLSAMLAIQANDYPTADAALTRIGSVIDRLPRGFYFLALSKLGMGQPAQAEEAASKYLARSPDDIAGLKLLAFVELARRQPATALHILQSGPLSAHPDADTLDLTGRAQAMSGDMKAASQSFTQAVAQAPNNVGILNRLAVAHLDLGDDSAAVADLRRSLQVDPDQKSANEAIVEASLAHGDIAGAHESVEALRKKLGETERVGVLSAQVKLAALDVDGARAELQDVLRQYPGSRGASLGLVRIARSRGDEKTAIALLEGLLQKSPADIGVLDLLLPTLYAEKSFDRAVFLCEAARSAAPDNQNIVAALAQAYVRNNQPDRAVALLDRASVGASPGLDTLRASILANEGKIDESERAYQNALRQTPDNVRLRADLAGVLTHAKRFDDARDVLRDGLRTSAGSPILLGALVGVDITEGGIKQALRTAAILGTDPKNLPAAWSLTGDALLATGSAKQAAEAYLSALHAHPSGELAAKAAGALSSEGAIAQAIALLTDWTTQHPQDFQAQTILSSLCINARRLPEAAQHLTDILAQRQSDAGTLNNLAWVKYEEGDASQAKTLAERAYFQAPVPAIADTLGWILARTDDYQRALPLLAQAITDQNPASQAAALYHYGYVLSRSNQPEEARTQIQKALDSKVKFPEREDAVKLLSTLH